MHPEGHGEMKFFVLTTKGVTVVFSNTPLLSFPCPQRRASQADRKGMLLPKCLCQGEEEDKRGRGISRVLATQDSPSSSLHHTEMEISPSCTEERSSGR